MVPSSPRSPLFGGIKHQRGRITIALNAKFWALSWNTAQAPRKRCSQLQWERVFQRRRGWPGQARVVQEEPELSLLLGTETSGPCMSLPHSAFPACPTRLCLHPPGAHLRQGSEAMMCWGGIPGSHRRQEVRQGREGRSFAQMSRRPQLILLGSTGMARAPERSPGVARKLRFSSVPVPPAEHCRLLGHQFPSTSSLPCVGPEGQRQVTSRKLGQEQKLCAPRG